uniref:Uncharacterized protein n=1 Tax=Peronospora matthiolae TaxID=2874970 RepID=A0AAV1T8L6_9STRA
MAEADGRLVSVDTPGFGYAVCGLEVHSSTKIGRLKVGRRRAAAGASKRVWKDWVYGNPTVYRRRTIGQALLRGYASCT